MSDWIFRVGGDYVFVVHGEPLPLAGFVRGFRCDQNAVPIAILVDTDGYQRWLNWHNVISFQTGEQWLASNR